MSGLTPSSLATRALLLLVLLQLLFLVLIPLDWVEDGIAREHGWLAASLGAQQADAVATRTRDLYRWLLVDTGVEAASYHHVLPDEVSPDDAFAATGDTWFPFIAGRLDILFLNLRQMLGRLCLQLTWLPLLVVLAAGAMLDGHLAWRLRAYGFGFTSPLAQHWAIEGIKLCLVLYLGLLIVPIAVPPWFAPALCFLVTAFVAMLARTLMKRV